MLIIKRLTGLLALLATFLLFVSVFSQAAELNVENFDVKSVSENSQKLPFKSKKERMVRSKSTIPVIRSDNPNYEDHIVMWLEKYGRQIQATRNMPDCKLLFIGDSITEHWPLKGYAPEIWRKYYSHRKTINIGSGGDATENILWRIENGIFNEISPKLVILMAGTNNTGHGDSPVEITNGIQAIIQSIHRQSPKTDILLHGIFPRGKDRYDKKRINNNQANILIEKLATKYPFVEYINIYALFLDGDGMLHEDIMPDLLHPNAKGYQIWAEAIENKIVSYLEL